MNKLMTYEQWEVLFKKRVKKYIKCRLCRFFYGTVLFLILFVPPVALIIHWIIVGY